MYKNLYENKINYLYKIDSVYRVQKSDYSFLLFNPYVNYWMPLDDIGAEIFLKIKELTSIDLVEKFFCDKYSITSDTFKQDCGELINTFVKRKFLLENEDLDNNKKNWMNLEHGFNLDIENYPFNEIYISLTDKCNLDCIYCFNKEQRHCRLKDKSLKPLTREKIEEILSEFKNIGGKAVVFTGGEPTLNKNFIDLCEYASSIGLSVNFITNGLLLGEIDLERLFKTTDIFGISFDSVVDAELNEMWNIPTENLSSILLSNLKKVDELAKKNNKEITINVMPIVSKINMSSTDKLVKTLLENLPNCNVTWSMTKYDEIDDEAVNKRMSITDNMYIDSVILGLSSVTPDNNYMNILSYAHNHANKKQPSQEPKIISCAPSFFLTNDGSIYPCQGCEKPEFYLGNAWNISLTEAFKTAPFEEVRRRVIKNNMHKCKDCELRYTCVAEGRPCVDKISDNCKQDCINRMFVQSLVD